MKIPLLRSVNVRSIIQIIYIKKEKYYFSTHNALTTRFPSTMEKPTQWQQLEYEKNQDTSNSHYTPQNRKISYQISQKKKEIDYSKISNPLEKNNKTLVINSNQIWVKPCSHMLLASHDSLMMLSLLRNDHGTCSQSPQCSQSKPPTHLSRCVSS